jgi:hypothetical protein
VVTVLCAALAEVASEPEARYRRLHDLYPLAQPEVEYYGGPYSRR